MDTGAVAADAKNIWQIRIYGSSTGTFAASVQNFSLFTRKIVPVYMYAQNAHKLIKYKSCL